MEVKIFLWRYEMKLVKRIDDGKTPWPRYYFWFIELPFKIGFYLYYKRGTK